jgi:hypothetical protein
MTAHMLAVGFGLPCHDCLGSARMQPAVLLIAFDALISSVDAYKQLFNLITAALLC